MRVAFVGKGGAGKSTIAGTLARLLARRGGDVVALDSDPMPGLALALGVPLLDAGLPDAAVEPYSDEHGRRRFRLPTGVSGADLVERYAVAAPDGVRFLQLGKARGPRWDNAAAHAGYQHVVDGLPPDRWHVVGDLPAGTRQAFAGWGRFAEVMVVVAEPTPASLLSARRLAALRGMRTAPRVYVVASKVRVAGDADDVARRCGLPLLGAVPFDPAMADAARAGAALLDHAPHAPAVTGVASVLDALFDASVGGSAGGSYGGSSGGASGGASGGPSGGPSGGSSGGAAVAPAERSA